MFASSILVQSPHLSPYHPYTSRHHIASPTTPYFHTPRSPVFLHAQHPNCTSETSFTSVRSGSDLSSSRKRSRPVIDRNRESSPCDLPFQRPIKRIRARPALSIGIVRPLNGIDSEGTSNPPTPHTALSSSMDTEMDISRSGAECSTAPIDNMLPPCSTRRTASPPNLPPRLCMKRANPKRLSLSLTMPSSNQSTPVVTPSVITPTLYIPSSNESTPYTPGPPKTPALALSLGRAPTKAMRRPSLLSLVTQPPSGYDDVPPTPGGNVPYAPGKARIRARSDTMPEVSMPSGFEQGSQSAHPSYQTFPPISEHHPAFGQSYQSTTSSSTSPETSPHSSASASTSTTPASSPPLPPAGFASALLYGPKPTEPYEDGPIEIIPNVFLGAEDSARDLSWARRYRSVRIINVAQEIESPYGSKCGSAEKVTLGTHQTTGPTVEYCHLRWSHGESGLSTIPQGATLNELLNTSSPDTEMDSWGFWNAIKWLEEARRNGMPVLIHCQCGISRSATLAIAYLMSLAVTGQAPEHLGHLQTMQETYDMVKAKSPCIGPNVSLVFQLVEFQRSLTTLLSEHVAKDDCQPIKTSFPTLAEQMLSEAEWARKRAEFEAESDDEDNSGLLASPLSPEEAGDEARKLDEAMVQRLRARGQVESTFV